MAMEASSHQLGASEYFQTRSKRQRSEKGGREEFCLNEDDIELARSLMMLANGNNYKEKRHVKKIEAFVEVPPCMPALTKSISVNDGKFHECSVCGKEFGSYQALGGHNASHRKSVASVEIEVAAGTVKFEKVEFGVSGCRVHECAICHKCFPSGQALGGHKRRHYRGLLGKQHEIHNDVENNIKANSNSEVTTATNSGGSGTSTMQWGIDLNISALPDFRQASGALGVEEVHIRPRNHVKPFRIRI